LSFCREACRELSSRICGLAEGGNVRAFSASALRCWCTKVAVITAIAFAGGLASTARPVAADQVAGVCPDGFVPVFAAVVPNGDKKDKNQNGLVCVKYSDSKIIGGPDDDTII
jgi:hypothetical protein